MSASAERPAPPVHLDDLRSSQDRDLRRVGIPMVLALRDETGVWTDPVTAAAPTTATAPATPTTAPAPATATQRDGRQLVDRLDELRADLAPGQRDEDLGVLVSLLTVAAHLDFGKGNEEEKR